MCCSVSVSIGGNYRILAFGEGPKPSSNVFVGENENSRGLNFDVFELGNHVNLRFEN